MKIVHFFIKYLWNRLDFVVENFCERKNDNITS